MIENKSLPIWIYKNNIVTENGKPYDLKKHLFLYDILRDWTPKQVWYKAAQVGGTLAAGIKSLYAVKNFGMDAIYTMPSQSDVNTLVGGKFNRMIQNNPKLREWVKDQDNVRQKQVGKNMIYYRGTWTETQAISVTSDLNIHDEEDRSKQDIIETYASRLDHSDHAWEWHFSNPSVPGNGVSKYWARSDQKEWFIKCSSCKKEQFMSWPDSVCKERMVFQCKHCKAIVTDDMRRSGRWIKKFKGKEWSGYHISQLMVTWKSAKDILETYENKPIDYFHNFVLGLPYVGEGNKLTAEALFRNCTQDMNNQERVVIGCDSGIKKHYVVGNKDGLFYYGVTEDWGEIARLLTRFKNSILVVDAMPDITGPRALREKFTGRVFLCHYARDRKTMQLVRWGKDNEAGNVLVDRNRMLQFVVDEFTQERIPLQGTRGDWEKYFSHWDTMFRQTELDSLGTPTFLWESSNGMDHWAHATAYWRTGMNKQGGGDAQIINDDTFMGIKKAPVVGYDNTWNPLDL